MSEAGLLAGREHARAGVGNDWWLLALALLASAALVWFVADQPIVAAGFLGGAAVLALASKALFRPRVQKAEGGPAEPDWVLTNAVIERPDAAMAVTDRAGRMVAASSLFEDLFGSDSAPPGLPLAGDGQARLQDLARRAWRDGAATDDAVRSGDSGWRVEVRRCGRADDYLVWTIAPMARADLVAEARQAVSETMGMLLGQAGVHAVVVAPDGALLAANDAFAERAAGQSAEALAGGDFVSLLAQDEQDRLFYAREGRSGVPLRLLHVPLAEEDRGEAIDPAQTSSLMLLVEAMDGEGQAGLAQIEALLARLPLGLAMTDRDGRFLFANQAFLRAAGHEERTPPSYPADLVIREDKGALVEAVRRYSHGSPTSGVVTVRLRANPNEPVSLSLAGVRGLGEAAVLLSVKDTTEETRLKRQVAQATKMQAVGQLAGGVAHDFNNVLTAIIGHCDLMLLRHTPGDSDYDDIQQIKANSNRAASLTRQLLAFSRQQTLRPQVLQLPDVVSEVSHMLKRLLGERIKLEVHHARDLGAVRADPGQLEQVIVNLAVNARDAILAKGDSGKLTLRTVAVSAAEIEAMNSDIIPVGDYTALVVEDTGGGIPPEIIGKIFEPFFTTKETGKGTGLGLSTAYGVVKQSGGFIFADSTPGKGTRFTIYLPVHQATGDEGEATAWPGPSSSLPATWSGGGRVLLVEDEETVRTVAERALTRAGYSVTTARDGEEGLHALTRENGFDVVVSDVVMPVMDGPTMARAIRKARPELPMLFMSGYAEEQLRREIDLPNLHFLAKPFSVREIGEAVERVLRQA